MKPPRVKVRVEGLSEMSANLGELSKATARNVLRRVLMNAGAPMADTMRRLAPDDPSTEGRDLKSSIAVSPRLKNSVGSAEFAQVMRMGGTVAQARSAMRDARRVANGSFAEVYVGPGKGGAHGVLQEFGTINHPPQPFMRPAWDQEKDGALEIIKRELGGEIDKAVKRARVRRAKKGK
jgi:HK97 gp10 family phage protein